MLELIAAASGSVGALIRLLGVPFCSGLEAAVKLLGALAQNVDDMAVEIVRKGRRATPVINDFKLIPSASGCASLIIG